MSDENGIHDECGHAYEAHADEGCVLCECAETLGRETGVPPEERVDFTIETT